MVKPNKNDPRYILWSKPQDPYTTRTASIYDPKSELCCARCYRTFKPMKHYQMYCSNDCEKVVEGKMEAIREKNLNGVCQECGLSFRNPHERSHRAFCFDCYRKHQREGYQKIPEAEKKPFKPKRRIPLEVLIKRSEHERVWKDSGWSHYLKGRKWDRI